MVVSFQYIIKKLIVICTVSVYQDLNLTFPSVRLETLGCSSGKTETTRN